MATRVSQALPGDLRFEPTPKRVRAQLGGETIADSRAAILVWEARRAVPVYAFPDADVQRDLLRDSADPLPDAHGGGATIWDVAVGGEVAVGHPRDPWHRVDERRSSRHVRVEVGGELLADSRSPTVAFETGLPTRYYLPRGDVAMDRLRRSDTVTICAYKGFASYWSVGDERDIVWTYEEPLPDAPPIAGLVCFFDEKVDITVDGAAVDRPRTQWSGGVRSAPRGGGSGARQGPRPARWRERATAGSARDVGRLTWPASSSRSRPSSPTHTPRTPSCSPRSR